MEADWDGPPSADQPSSADALDSLKPRAAALMPVTSYPGNNLYRASRYEGARSSSNLFEAPTSTGHAGVSVVSEPLGDSAALQHLLLTPDSSSPAIASVMRMHSTLSSSQLSDVTSAAGGDPQNPAGREDGMTSCDFFTTNGSSLQPSVDLPPLGQDGGAAAAAGFASGSKSALSSALMAPQEADEPVASGASASALPGGSSPPSSLAAPAQHNQDEFSCLVGRRVVIDVVHWPTAMQLIQSCEHLGMVAEAGDSRTPSGRQSEKDSAVATTPYDMAVVSVERATESIRSHWKGRPLVVIGDRLGLPRNLHPLAVFLPLPAKHSRLASALLKSAVLLQVGCPSTAPPRG